jgi:hypothetical protein
MTKRRPFVFPRNLTARAAAREVVGNPVTTRMESAVGNCFPGLEFDIRVLDCRFFPGLVFQYVTEPLYPAKDAIPNQQGARALYSDWLLDPMLPETSEEQWVQDLLAQYRGPLATAFMDGARWYLDWIEQGGTHISMTDPGGTYYDGELVWRLVRCLEPGKPLKIGIARRDSGDNKPRTVTLSGYRRRYVNAAGIFDEAFRPGELTEAMCNPWTHDFRDCACHYWASNHPDVVIRADAPEVDDTKTTVKIPDAAALRFNWLSARGPAAQASAFHTIAENRRFEIDHYEINHIWQSLPFVLEGREIEGPYVPPTAIKNKPYANAQELIKELEEELCPMELALALQYLYALFSLKDPASVPKDPWPTLADDLKTVRQIVLLVAVGEMAHLRLVNRLLMILDQHGLYPNGRHYKPVVRWNPHVKHAGFDVRMRRLDPETLADFIKIERPKGNIDTAYHRCIATLQQDGYPKEALELAMRIDGDGVDHFHRFVNAHHILTSYGDPEVYLRPVKQLTGPETEPAMRLFRAVLTAIEHAYQAEAGGDYAASEQGVEKARRVMLEFRDAAEHAAARGFGLPLLDDPRGTYAS